MKNLRGLFAALMKSPAVPIATVMTVAFTAAAGLAFLPLAHAAPPQVWVCKYVSTPNGDETLKEGKQPILVSSNAVVGTWFNDGQTKSYVLADQTVQNTGKGETYIPGEKCPAKGPNVTPPTPKVTNDHKSYICKYVGQPGVDERLQSGQNPIWVDNHSLLGHDGTTEVGQQFSDAQGRSVVIVANTAKLTPEPGIDKCPAAVGPPKTPKVTTTTSSTPVSTTAVATTSASSRGVAAHAGGDDDSGAIIAIGAIVLVLGLGGARLLQRRRQSA
jgi:MYXO-CTERM domain-containing protein